MFKWLMVALVLCVGNSVNAASLAVGDSVGQAGDMVEVSINLHDLVGPVLEFNIDAVLDFDDTHLTLIDVLPGAARDAEPNPLYFIQFGGLNPGGFSLSAIFSNEQIIDAEVLIAKFNIAPNATPDTYEIGLSDVMLDDNAIASSAGQLTVTAIPLPAAGLFFISAILSSLFAGLRTRS